MTQTKKQPTEKQLAARKKFGEAAKARAVARKAQNTVNNNLDGITPIQVPTNNPTLQTPSIGQEPSVEDLKRQIDELKAYLFSQNQQSAQSGQQVPQFGSQGKMTGVFEKYLVDPANYPSPVERLSQEARLAPFAFGYNYHLNFTIAVSEYETKEGINTKEPRFTLELYRKRYDDMGEPILVENPETKKKHQSAFVVGTMIFHEDPQAALIIAREKGLDVDKTDEPRFLNEMRYLRCRDWLIDLFFPRTTPSTSKRQELVVDGKMMQVVTIDSETTEAIPFKDLKKAKF